MDEIISSLTSAFTLAFVVTSMFSLGLRVNGRLYISGISEYVYDQIVITGKLRLSGPVRIFEAKPVRGQSTHAAVVDARNWLVKNTEEEEAAPTS